MILTRRIGETIHIGDDVSVTVMGTQGNQVPIGIQAPKSVAIFREEIFNRIQVENKESDVSSEAEPRSGDG